MSVNLANAIKIKKPKYFNLEATLNCGQCFRWEQQDDGSYSGVVRGELLNIATYDDIIAFKNTSEETVEKLWKDYFDLNTNYEEIAQELGKVSPNMSNAIKYAPGIRILRQEAFEALCSFIISQNNNIPRIKKIISLLCEKYGKVCKNNENYYEFPTSEVIASLKPQDLREIGCGFRDTYLIDAAKKVENKKIDLKLINEMPIDEARLELQKIKGVGPKVAECTLLYGMHRMECFPKDVWIKRAMTDLFPNVNYEIFGKNAGIAQQYIYHFYRSIKNNS